MIEQGRNLTSMISVAVGMLSKPERIRLAVRQLGERHAGYGVERRHYELVGTSLIWTLEKCLGEAFTPEVKAAWWATYAFLSEGMRRRRAHPSSQTNRRSAPSDPARRAAARGLREVTASLTSAVALLKTIDRLKPDVIVIDTESPSRDVLEHLVVMSQHTPRPVVMFASDGAPETIREAVRAGVSAYVVDGLDKDRIKGIIDVAVARFEDFQRLREELADATLKLSERKVVERAKGLLMKGRGMDEETAYTWLRKTAMDRKLKLAEVAQRVLVVHRNSA
jgi:response regulator NasT